MAPNVAEAIAEHVRRHRPVLIPRIEPTYRSLPLCAVDAVFSINAHYKTAVNTVARVAQVVGISSVRDRRLLDMSPGEMGVSDFLDKLEASGGPTLFGNLQQTSARNGIRKSEATLLVLEALNSSEINDFPDITPERLDAAETKVLAIKGQGSGVMWSYLRMMLGHDTVKADRRIIAFVAEALGVSVDRVLPMLVTEAMTNAAILLKDDGFTPVTLDAAIWNRDDSSSNSPSATNI